METAVLQRSHFSPATAPSFNKPADDCEWTLFDIRVDLLKFPPSNSTTAYCKTSNNRDVFASLHLAAPPDSSFLQLYTDDEVSEEPTVVAADADLLLIHMVVAVEGSPTEEVADNFFVYKPHPDWPYMRPLPPPIDWKMRPGDTGIARWGKEFVVANLNNVVDFKSKTERDVEEAVLWLYRSGAKMWETKRLDMPYDPEKGLVEFEWNTDTVFTFQGFICWVDYHRGIMYYDVFSPKSELGFLRFPGIEMWRGDREFPNMYRTVSVCKGHLKFVNVDNGKFRSTDDNYSVSIGSDDDGCNKSNKTEDSDWSISTWTLKIPEFEWENDAAPFKLKKLWSLPKYRDSRLPRTVPTFPIFNLEEPNVLFFIVNGPKFFDKSWVITVDMKNRSLRPPRLYKNPLKGEASGYDLTNSFLDVPMICSELAKYLKYPAGYL